MIKIEQFSMFYETIFNDDYDETCVVLSLLWCKTLHIISLLQILIFHMYS